MAAISMLYSAINFCVILFTLLCPLSSYASQEAINLTSACPEVLTTANLKNRSPINETLLVVVPWKIGFEQFVKFDPDSCLFDGFSVQVFLQAVRRMRRRSLTFEFVLYGNGTLTPPYDDLIDMVAGGEVDAAVADLTITRERMEKVAFTTPYLASSLVMVTPFSYGSSGSLWHFLEPFSMELWVILLGCFLATGVALYLLENQNPDFSITTSKYNDVDSGKRNIAAPPRNDSAHGLDLTNISTSSSSNPSSARNDSAPGLELTDISTASCSNPSSLQHLGPKASHKRRIVDAYWFTSLCVFTAQQEIVRTHLGRCVTVMWLFLMLIFNSSYTASLSSLISTQKRYPTIEAFQDLLNNNNISVGYQMGSFLTNYMEKIQIDQHRLKNFTSLREYAKALREGNFKPDGVGVVLDELPYIQILLQSECDVTKNFDDGSLPSFGGFGFAFQNNSSVIEDVSKMILAMEEDGTLQVLKNGWGIGGGENDGRCNSSEEPYHLRLRSFGGLFIILAGAYVSCILMRLLVKSKERRCISNQVSDWSLDHHTRP